MRIAIGSLFRNSAGFPLQRYFRQIDAFRDHLKDRGAKLRVIAVEGDSTDDTRFELMRYAEGLALSINIVTRNHGQRVFGSTEEPARMKALSFVGNGVFESVQDEDTVLIYVESDLLWQPDTMTRLIDRLGEQTYLDGRPANVIAPLVFAGQAFYDIWGFRKDGHRFGPFHPYHSKLKFDGLTAVDSVGSCLVMHAEVARQCRMIEDYALVGFCKDVWAKGFTVFADARERIYHP